MVARQGRGTSLLICTDCGHPLDARLDSRGWRRIAAAALMIGMLALAGWAVFFLASITAANGPAPLLDPEGRERPHERE
jgi:hypothetical protein